MIPTLMSLPCTKKKDKEDSLRHIYQGTFNDGNGRVVTEGNISVFEAGTATPADVYTASAGGSAVNSVTSDSTDGSFIFWADDTDYGPSQLFKITLSKTNFTPKSYDYIKVYPSTAGHTVPDVADDTLCLLDATQTLINKTITDPVINTIYSGTYTAVASNVVNLIGAPPNHTAQYMRVGDTVTVSGVINIDPVTTTLSTGFDLTLPISSNLGSEAHLAGAGQKKDETATVIDPFMIYADYAGDEARFRGYPVGVQANDLAYTYTYQII